MKATRIEVSPEWDRHIGDHQIITLVYADGSRSDIEWTPQHLAVKRVIEISEITGISVIVESEALPVTFL